MLEDFDRRNMILTMYILKHLRGNAILEATHENDTFDLLGLARALLCRQVALNGAFVQIQ